MVRIDVKIVRRVNANRPYAERHSAESPQLLRNPHHILRIAVGIESQSVADRANTQINESRNRILIE